MAHRDIDRRNRTLDESIGRRIRQRRIELGLSQQKLSRAVGVSPQQLQKYERGQNRTGGGMIWQLSRSLDVSPAYFFEDFGGAAAGSKANASDARGAGSNDRTTPIFSDREIMELLKAYRGVADPQVRKSVRHMLAAIAGPARPRWSRARRKAAGTN